MKVYLVTTNESKLLAAQRVLERHGVDLEMLSLPYEVPEIQSLTVEEVAKFSATYVANREQKPVIVTDVGYSITALNGFPGPFVKYFNHYLSPEDILRLMAGKTDRSYTVRECLAFGRPGMEAVTFTATAKESIAKKAEGEGTSLSKLMIWDGQDKVQTNYSHEEMIEYYAKHLNHYEQFGEFYKSIT